MAPGRTPPEIVARLNRELVKVLEMPEIRDQLFTHGMEPMPGSSEALA
ncbi:MAG: tripartite tricarboxylate transporter substrate binding protein, partial [Betaproteobacteria bacterium]|nr:tripartite tricarboxylate transporter substrate binding protein [Betaproteobacteria bacterium]